MLIPLVVFKLCPGQEKGTDGKTDGQGGDYMLPRKNKKVMKANIFLLAFFLILLEAYESTIHSGEMISFLSTQFIHKRHAGMM
jgi:hypothetical protein